MSQATVDELFGPAGATTRPAPPPWPTPPQPAPPLTVAAPVPAPITPERARRPTQIWLEPGNDDFYEAVRREFRRQGRGNTLTLSSVVRYCLERAATTEGPVVIAAAITDPAANR